MKRASMRLVSLVVFLMVSLGAQAQEFQISDIRVEGLQRVSAGSVFSALPVRVGDTLRGDDIQRATRALFRVGHFADVTMARDGDVLVIQVVERPAINEILIEGNRVIKTEALMDSLSDKGLAEGQICQRANPANIRQAMEQRSVGEIRYI